VRLVIGVLAAIGLVASVTVYVLTFFPERIVIAPNQALFATLHIGTMAAFVPFVWALRQRLGVFPRSWRQYLSVFPAWAATLIVLAGACEAVNFMYLFFELQGSPEIRDGQFVLMNHGTFVRTLTQEEYDVARSHETRLFSGGWIAFYLIPTLYFLFTPKPAASSRAERQSP